MTCSETAHLSAVLGSSGYFRAKPVVGAGVTGERATLVEIGH
jgi:hypothetical protein